MTVTQLKVYSLLQSVPEGRLTTYKELASAIGMRAYRLVGRYMGENPYPFMTCTDPKKRIPCHRVVSSNGTIGGFMEKHLEEIKRKFRSWKKE
jgi:methylated-DNA-[protein]-cysteine S-methyltransferase